MFPTPNWISATFLATRSAIDRYYDAGLVLEAGCRPLDVFSVTSYYQNRQHDPALTAWQIHQHILREERDQKLQAEQRPLEVDKVRIGNETSLDPPARGPVITPLNPVTVEEFEKETEAIKQRFRETVPKRRQPRRVEQGGEEGGRAAPPTEREPAKAKRPRKRVQPQSQPPSPVPVEKQATEERLERDMETPVNAAVRGLFNFELLRGRPQPINPEVTKFVQENVSEAISNITDRKIEEVFQGERMKDVAISLTPWSAADYHDNIPTVGDLIAKISELVAKTGSTIAIIFALSWQSLELAAPFPALLRAVKTKAGWECTVNVVIAADGHEEFRKVQDGLFGSLGDDIKKKCSNKGVVAKAVGKGCLIQKKPEEKLTKEERGAIAALQLVQFAKGLSSESVCNISFAKSREFLQAIYAPSRLQNILDIPVSSSFFQRTARGDYPIIFAEGVGLAEAVRKPVVIEQTPFMQSDPLVTATYASGPVIILNIIEPKKAKKPRAAKKGKEETNYEALAEKIRARQRPTFSAPVVPGGPAHSPGLSPAPAPLPPAVPPAAIPSPIPSTPPAVVPSPIPSIPPVVVPSPIQSIPPAVVPSPIQSTPPAVVPSPSAPPRPQPQPSPVIPLAVVSAPPSPEKVTEEEPDTIKYGNAVVRGLLNYELMHGHVRPRADAEGVAAYVKQVISPAMTDDVSSGARRVLGDDRLKNVALSLASWSVEDYKDGVPTVGSLVSAVGKIKAAEGMHLAVLFPLTWKTSDRVRVLPTLLAAEKLKTTWWCFLRTVCTEQEALTAESCMSQIVEEMTAELKRTCSEKEVGISIDVHAYKLRIEPGEPELEDDDYSALSVLQILQLAQGKSTSRVSEVSFISQSGLHGPLYRAALRDEFRIPLQASRFIEKVGEPYPHIYSDGTGLAEAVTKEVAESKEIVKALASYRQNDIVGAIMQDVSFRVFEEKEKEEEMKEEEAVAAEAMAEMGKKEKKEEGEESPEKGPETGEEEEEEEQEAWTAEGE